MLPPPSGESGERGLPHIGAAELFAAVSPVDAVDLVIDALRRGLDPAADPGRGSVRFDAGELLTMPAEFAGRAGVKLAFVAPGNGARGHARIQGVYVLLDSATLVPLATLDGPALTALRTPAVSVAAVESALLRTATPARVAVVGTGAQAVGHARVLHDRLLGRRPLERTTFLARTDRPLPAGATPGADLVPLGGPGGRSVLAAADVVVCATSAVDPVVDSELLGDRVVVMAVGSHEPDKRELDTALMSRAAVVVEDRGTALREAGDVIQAIADGGLQESHLLEMADVVRGTVRLPADRPVVFKGSGMAWQDLVVAAAVHRRWTSVRDGRPLEVTR